MMRVGIETGYSYGKWKDVWIERPVPTINESHKVVSRITAQESTDEGRKVDIFLVAGLAWIDNVLVKKRRRWSTRSELQVGTNASGTAQQSS